MEQNLIDIYDLVEHAIDNAFEGNMNLKFYDFLKSNKIKRHEIESFIESTTAAEISDITLDLEEYINGGSKTTNTNNCVRDMGIFPNHKQEKLRITCTAS